MRNTLPKSVCGIKYIYKFIGVWCTGNNKVYIDIIKVTENRVSMYTWAPPPIPNIKYIKYKVWWVPWPTGMSYPSHVIRGECPYCFRTPLPPKKNKNENDNDYNGHTHLSNAAIKFQLPNTCSKRKGGITKPSFFQWLFLASQHPHTPTPRPPTPTPTPSPHPHTHTHTPITISSQSCSYHTGHIFGGKEICICLNAQRSHVQNGIHFYLYVDFALKVKVNQPNTNEYTDAGKSLHSGFSWKFSFIDYKPLESNISFLFQRFGFIESEFQVAVIKNVVYINNIFKVRSQSKKLYNTFLQWK